MNPSYDAIRKLSISDETHVAGLIDDRPSVFLSASVPYLRDFPAEVDVKEKDANRRFFTTRSEPLIRAAVASFGREVVSRDIRVVFGAHPAISPMLLTALQDASRGEILVFQSALFQASFPTSTLALAAWSRGKLVVTAERKATAVSPNASSEYVQWLNRKASLTFMRRCMAHVPGLRAAIFIGGMDGTIEEAEIFRKVTKKYNHCYAYAASGSAAKELLDQSPTEYSGNVALDILNDDLSPSLAMRKIFADIP